MTTGRINQVALTAIGGRKPAGGPSGSARGSSPGSCFSPRGGRRGVRSRPPSAPRSGPPPRRRAGRPPVRLLFGLLSPLSGGPPPPGGFGRSRGSGRSARARESRPRSGGSRLAPPPWLGCSAPWGPSAMPSRTPFGSPGPLFLVSPGGGAETEVFAGPGRRAARRREQSVCQCVSAAGSGGRRRRPRVLPSPPEGQTSGTSARLTAPVRPLHLSGSRKAVGRPPLSAARMAEPIRIYFLVSVRPYAFLALCPPLVETRPGRDRRISASLARPGEADRISFVSH